LAVLDHGSPSARPGASPAKRAVGANGPRPVQSCLSAAYKKGRGVFRVPQAQAPRERRLVLGHTIRKAVPVPKKERPIKPADTGGPHRVHLLARKLDVVPIIVLPEIGRAACRVGAEARGTAAA